MVSATVQLYGERHFYQDEGTKFIIKHDQEIEITKQRTMMSRSLRQLLIQNLLLVTEGKFEFDNISNGVKVHVEITPGEEGNTITETPIEEE